MFSEKVGTLVFLQGAIKREDCRSLSEKVAGGWRTVLAHGLWRAPAPSGPRSRGEG